VAEVVLVAEVVPEAVAAAGTGTDMETVTTEMATISSVGRRRGRSSSSTIDFEY
jgi:hypothetical protein